MRIINLIKKYGIKCCLQKGILRLLGIDKKIEKQQEAITAIFYYLNNYLITDLTSLPPTNDENLRIMQKCDVALLLILDKICRKHYIDYWLDFGTLLGAIRHEGFIPWDDDMDVACLSKDYYKLLNILRQELPNDDFDIADDHENPMGRIGFGYKHQSTGIWIDICPVDEFKTNIYSKNIYEEVKLKRKEWRKYYLKHKHCFTTDRLIDKKNKIFDSKQEGEYTIYHHGCEFLHQRPVLCEKNTIFPLKEHKFDDFRFYVPQNYSEYLRLMYGDNFLKLPQGGILHHSLGRGDLSTWALKSNTNMYSVYEYLLGIAKSI